MPQPCQSPTRIAVERESLRRWRVAGFTLCVALAVLIFRITALSHMEPRIDQAYFAAWVQDIVRADHLLPTHVGSEGFTSALEADASSAAHHVALRLYNKHHNLFTVLPAVILSMTLHPVDAAYEGQVVWSIMVSAAIIFVAPFFLSLGGGWAPESLLYGPLLASLAIATCAYLHYLSAFGVHNFGICALYAAALTIQYVLLRLGQVQMTTRRVFILLSSATLAATYAHWTNIFLLPIAVSAALLIYAPYRIWNRLGMIACYAVVLSICIGLPVFVLSRVGPGSSTSDFVYSGFAGAQVISSMATRALQWFVVGTLLLSPGGFLLGLAGLAALGIRRRVWMPLLLAGAHFAVWSIMPGFSWNGSNSGLRTYPYVLPAICIGIGVVASTSIANFLTALRRKRWGLLAASVALWVVMFWHGTREAHAILNPATAAARFPQFWAEYMVGQGRLRPLVHTIETTVGSKYLLTWNYELKYMIGALASHRLTGYNLPPVANLIHRAESGDLERYRHARRLRVLSDQSVCFVSDNSVDVNRGGFLVQRALALLDDHAPRHGRLAPLRSWDTATGAYGTVRLSTFE